MYQSLSQQDNDLKLWEFEWNMFGKENKSLLCVGLMEEQDMQSGSFEEVLRWIFSNGSKNRHCFESSPGPASLRL